MAGKHVLVDMDNVLVATMQGYNKRLDEMFPEIKIIPYEQITDHNFHELYPKELVPKLEKVWKSQGLFLRLAPISGALEAIEGISRNNDVLICSRPFLDSPFCESEKKEWIRAYLGREWAKRLVLVRDKTRIRGELLIDDHPGQEKGAYTPDWEHVLYTQPWNIQDTQRRRLTWENWKQVLPELL
jgi:5'-nucleotidase